MGCFLGLPSLARWVWTLGWVVSLVELRWLSLEKAHPRYLRPGRPISVSAVPFGPGIDIWRSCRFIGAMMRSLCLLPGGLGRFVRCLLVLIIVGFELWSWTSPREHGRVLRRFSWMSCCSSFSTLLSLPVRCSLVHFPWVLRC